MIPPSLIRGPHSKDISECSICDAKESLVSNSKDCYGGVTSCIGTLSCHGQIWSLTLFNDCAKVQGVQLHTCEQALFQSLSGFFPKHYLFPRFSSASLISSLSAPVHLSSSLISCSLPLLSFPHLSSFLQLFLVFAQTLQYTETLQ